MAQQGTIYAQEVISLVRTLLNDTGPGVGQRFSDATLLQFLTQVGTEVMRDVRFPWARISTATVASTQEYQLPEIVETVTVYVNGQISVPSDLRTLEGHQTQLYDQGVYGGTASQAPGSGGPSGTSGPYSPKWNVQPPMSYPVANNWTWPAPDAQAWNTGQRPRYYFRGGFLGLVPAPANAAPVVNGVTIDNLVIDCVMVPPPVQNLTDLLWFGQLFVPALAFGVVMYTKFSDDTNTSKESRNFAQGKYNEQVSKLRMWASAYKGDAADGPKLETNRGFYFAQPYRSPSGSTGYP